MQRREFLILGALLSIEPLDARAQQQAKRPRVGILIYSTPKTDTNIQVFIRALQDVGYVDGQNVILEYRYAEGKPERLPQLAAELVSLNPDVLLAMGGDVTPFVTQATQSTAIVFVMSADPVQLGVVASLARPGGNATGFTFLHDKLAGKRLQFLKEMVPQISRVAVLFNPDHPDNEPREVRRTAALLGVQVQSIEFRGPGDLDVAFRTAIQGGADAFYVVSSRQTILNMPQIVAFATENKLPLAGGWGDWAKAGALLSYGPNTSSISRQAATYVDKILKGVRPADLPVQQPVNFELIINGRTAKVLGLTIPHSVIAQADELIE